MTLEMAATYIDFVFVGLCVFCANLLFLRRRDVGVYVPLALLFQFLGISVFVDAFAMASAGAETLHLLARLSIGIGVLDYCCPFLAWLYVRGLTSEGDLARPRKLGYHLAPIVLMTVLTTPLAFFPSGFIEGEMLASERGTDVLLILSFAVLLGVLLFVIVIGVYLVLIIRRLRVYRARLRDVFSSTEHREMAWIWALLVAGVAYWLFNLAFHAGLVFGEGHEDSSEVFHVLTSLARMALFWVLGIWGLRQRPGLTRTALVDPPEPEVTPAPKYEKSALDDERATHIAAKIEAAMSKDQLYREPNLSLWDMAKHINVTSHYVS